MATSSLLMDEGEKSIRAMMLQPASWTRAPPEEIAVMKAMYRAMGFGVVDLQPDPSKPDFIVGTALVCKASEVL